MVGNWVTSDKEALSTRYEYSGDDLIYIGEHPNSPADASTSLANWKVYKLTWTDGNLTKKEGPIFGAWDDRATLGWS